jgi:D-glycero-D-manno-heptose 1,7-bisphosphate phosphatase
LQAIARLNHGGYRVVIATNQSAIARGLLDMSTLNAIHDKMHKAVTQVGGRIDAIFYCPHAPDSECDCRKPKAGLLEDIARRFGADLTAVPCVGDAKRDLLAARDAKAQPILVLTGKGAATLAAGGLPENTQVYADLEEVAGALAP